MYLRKLEEKDAPLMLEWMHDESVVHDLHTNFSSKTLQDCESFIKSSVVDKKNMHMAVVSDLDEYMGTVSLKEINYENLSAEFAITVRKKAMGHGYSWYGMKEIINYAFTTLNLNSVYWCVSKKNTRAVRFYDKHNFQEVVDVPQTVLDRYKNEEELKWYSVMKGELVDVRETIVGCRVVRIKTMSTVDAGELSFFEANKDIPFAINRIYYISKVSEGVRRGFHAHKKLKQLLFCPYGRIQLLLENELGREEIELNDPSVGVIIDKPTWREMLWLEKNSVLCVAASDYYQTEDYIRNYEEFKNYLKGGR